MADETSKQFPECDALLKAIDDLGKSLKEKIDNLEKSNNIQFEAIRRGIAENSAAFDRFEAKFLLTPRRFPGYVRRNQADETRIFGVKKTYHYERTHSK